MRISDWSSDVCSSDLDGESRLGQRIEIDQSRRDEVAVIVGDVITQIKSRRQADAPLGEEVPPKDSSYGQSGIGFIQMVDRIVVDVEIGSTSCRERVCQYV